MTPTMSMSLKEAETVDFIGFLLFFHFTGELLKTLKIKDPRRPVSGSVSTSVSAFNPRQAASFLSP